MIHREIFRWYWRKKSEGGQKKPKIDADTINLIREIAKENPLWGGERIQGELLKLGIKISKRTVQKYMVRARKAASPGQNWATFLKNHAGEIWACDFTTAYDWLFRQYYIFVIIDLKTRRVIHWAMTQAPSDEWTSQQVREATPWNEGPKYLIRDRDSKYGSRFSAICRGSGIQELKTPYRTPNANAVCERFMGSLRRECLDQYLFFSGRHLERVVKEYVVGYYNEERPHQGINQQIPVNYDRPRANTSGKVRSRPVMGGLYRSYSRDATGISGG